MSRAVKRVPAEHMQQRGRERREALLRAALEVLAEGGMKAVTHRAVAARARVPLASTTYYFESIEQIVEEALLLGVEERVARLRPLVSATRAPEQSVPELAGAFVSTVLARPEAEILAQLEVYLEAARNPALRDAAASAIGMFEQVAASRARRRRRRRLRLGGDGDCSERPGRRLRAPPHRPPRRPGAGVRCLVQGTAGAVHHPRRDGGRAAVWTERLRARVPVSGSAAAGDQPR